MAQDTSSSARKASAPQGRRPAQATCYRCRCGNLEVIGSRPPHPCDRCPSCLSDLAETPDRHQAPLPHDFEGYVEQTSTGPAVVARCRWCRRTREQLQAAA